MHSRRARLKYWLGVEDASISHREKMVSAVGGFIGLLAVGLVGRALGDPAAWLTFSVGASAVLVFAVPHGALSQPWPVLGGHLVSALIGVSCARWLADPVIAMALAMGLSLAAMHYLHCIHPPGGATALVAVAGGEHIHQLGYSFVLSPLLLNVIVLLLVAVAYNAFFPWRRYPAVWAPAFSRNSAGRGEPRIRHADFVFALTQMESFIDVSEADLARIYAVATEHAAAESGKSMPP